MNLKLSKLLFILTLAVPFAAAGCVITVGDGYCGYDCSDSEDATTNIVVITSNTTVVVTNENYFTNVVTNLVQGYCDITIDSPSDGVYVDGSFTVSGSVACPGRSTASLSISRPQTRRA
jgi:hypothetical protein